ncbi:UvrABC system protein B [bioreactor metagenome]|uniref:UvrABC system protein B n=1 Tax=bioreactor metagenome TaxID=1076179 RepID=A0A645FWM9_9ZZZZ
MVAILDADKEGFLRSATALIQTIGRAARNINGKVIMYADKMTDAMTRAIEETNRRRTKQVAYNDKNGIKPYTIIKAVHDITERLTLAPSMAAEGRGEYKAGKGKPTIPEKEIKRLIDEMEKQMHQAAKDLEFEQAAVFRDQILDLRNLLAEESNLPPWKKAKLMAGEVE